nr:glycosyl hydrolase family 18 protein [Burkholderia metallica]
MLKLNRKKPNSCQAPRAGRPRMLPVAALAAASTLCFAGHALAAPGKPSLKSYEITSKPHGFVEIDLQKAMGGGPTYKDVVKLNKKVGVPLPFDIWSNGTAVKAVAVVDGVVDSTSVVRMTPGGTQSGTVVANIKTPGMKKMQVRVTDANGASSDSAPIDVTVFDTLPELADDLPDNASKTNKPYKNTSGSVVGTYFTSWSIYDRHYNVDNVPVESLTHMLYGFIPICGGQNVNASLAHDMPSSFNTLQQSCSGLPDFSVTIHDIYGEIAKALPGQGANSKLKGVLGQMMAAKKRNPQLKILPSIGGWTLSDPFFQMHDPVKRKVFVDSVEHLLRTWKFFDGVDIDWEFPGGKGANPSIGNPQTDGALYVTLMKELRQMLDKMSKETGKTYQLTSAIGAGQDKIGVVNYKEATKYMDYLFDMTYDFYGAFNLKELGHQTALYAPAWKPDTRYTTDNSIKALLEQGVDPKKLVVGAAMYGRGWTGVSGYKDDIPFTGTAKGPVAGGWEPGVLDYKAIKAKMLGANNVGINGYEYRYDQNAEAPYVFNKSTGDLITFDDERSVIAKGEYVRKQQLGGLFSWEIDADNGEILNAMHKGLGHDGGETGNRAPIARAGANRTVTGAQTITLDASQSRDPDGDKLTFKWEQIGGDSLTLRNPTRAKATVDVPSVKQDTKYTFRVTVTDPSGLHDSAQVIVTAKVDSSDDPTPVKNHPPVARLDGPATVTAGQNVVLSAEKSTDPDGDKLTFEWSVPPGITAKPAGATLRFSAPSLPKNQSFAFSVKVSDGKLSSTATRTVIVKAKESSGGETGKHPAYKAGAPYNAGDIVSNAGKLYQCKPFPFSGWCSGSPAAYEPGKGFAWSDAWTLYGDDTGGSSGGGGESDDGPQYKEGTQYKAGDIVSNQGKLYRCKSFPYTNWCSMAAWAYEPGKGSAWEQAWEEYKK